MDLEPADRPLAEPEDLSESAYDPLIEPSGDTLSDPDLLLWDLGFFGDMDLPP